MNFLAFRHQLMVEYHLDGSHLFNTPLHMESIKVFNILSLDTSWRSAVQTFHNKVSLSSNIHLNGIKYTGGMIISGILQ